MSTSWIGSENNITTRNTTAVAMINFNVCRLSGARHAILIATRYAAKATANRHITPMMGRSVVTLSNSNRQLRKRSETTSSLHSPACGRVGLSGPERALPGRYRVRPSRPREGEAKANSELVFERFLSSDTAPYRHVDNAASIVSAPAFAPEPGSLLSNPVDSPVTLPLGGATEGRATAYWFLAFRIEQSCREPWIPP